MFWYTIIKKSKLEQLENENIFMNKEIYRLKTQDIKMPSMEEFYNDWYHTITDSYPW